MMMRMMTVVDVHKNSSALPTLVLRTRLANSPSKETKWALYHLDHSTAKAAGRMFGESIKRVEYHRLAKLL